LKGDGRGWHRTPVKLARSLLNFIKMNHHPEQSDDEIYLGNATLEDMFDSTWKTSRLGYNPLGNEGQSLFNSGLKPWFIKKSEVWAAIETETSLGDPFGRVKAYEKMLKDEIFA
jgi:hypothetical protein